MTFDNFSFGSLRIDGSTYEHDVVIDRGQIRKMQESAVQAIPRGLRTHTAIH